jgi:site-specific recombinase XerD
MSKNVDIYLDWKATYTRRASVNYRIWLDKFIDCTKRDIEDAEVGDIVKYRNWMEDNNYQPKSIELSMVILKNYFHFWKLQGVKCLSPELIRVPRTVANSHQPISFEEYCSILTFIHPTDFWEFQKLIIVRLLFETGIRVSELCDINISDIDPKKSNTTIRTKKTAKMRTIFWSVETHIMVREFLIQRIILNSTNALFVGKITNGTCTKRMTTRTVQRIIKALCVKAKIEKKITPHSFRHGKAHRVLDLGGYPKDVQAILGHCDPSSSFTYMQWNDKEFAKRAKKFL